MDPKKSSCIADHEEEEEEALEVADSEQKENEFTHRTSPRTKLFQRSKSRYVDESSEEEEGDDTDDGNVEEPTKPNTKRALTDAKGRKDSSKKTKVAKDQHTANKAGASGGRVFSPADDIVLLGGMIDYKKETSADPHADMRALLEFVKGCFVFELTRTQLYEKVRRLKRKFFTNLGKGEKFVPTKPFDQECFELSKKLWGSNNVVVDNGVDHTEAVKRVDGVSVTKNSAKRKRSEEKRKEKIEKKKKESHKSNNSKKKKMDVGPKIVQEEPDPMTNQDVMTDEEDDSKDDEDVMIDKEAVGKDDDGVTKETEDVGNNDENTVKDGEQHIQFNYPNFVASLSMDIPDSQRKLMMEGISLVDVEKARALDGRWRKLHIEEIEFHYRKLQLMAEHSRLLMDAWKKKRVGQNPEKNSRLY